MYKSLHDEGDIQAKVDEQERLINLAVKKKGKLLELIATEQVTDKEFAVLKQQCEDEITQAEAEIRELAERDQSRAEFKKNIDNIRQILRDAQKDAAEGIINKGFIDRYIDRILIAPENGAMRLEIRLFTGEKTEKFLANLRARSAHPVQRDAGRMGHTSKKMIQAYENNLK
jgi:hypothetical protein